MSVVLGPQAATLRDVLLLRLEREPSTQMRVAILRFIKQAALTQPGLSQLLTDIRRKKVTETAASATDNAAPTTSKAPPPLTSSTSASTADDAPGFELGENR